MTINLMGIIISFIAGVGFAHYNLIGHAIISFGITIIFFSRMVADEK